MGFKNHAMDRRSFLKGALATTALGASAVTLGCTSEKAGGGEVDSNASSFEQNLEWDAEYDVVVVGFGGAGAATAITAADAGAKVLLLEKAPEGYAGGNSNVCMQWVCYSEDKEKMQTYFKTLRGEYESPSDAMLNVYIDEMMKNKAWFESLGATNVTPFDYHEFPEFPGVEAFTPITTNGNNGINKPTNFGGDGETYNFLKNNVLSRSDSIDVWYEAPGKSLVQDPVTKIIHGIVAVVNEKDITIRAKNGVVLTCGGYENNPKMQQDYNQRKFWPSLGRALYNEGDGIKMAQAVGADLWHMSNIVSTNGEFYDWETQTASFVFMIYGASCGIVVGDDGTRMKEDDIVFGRGQRHGKLWNHGMYMNAWLPDSMYYIFDQSILDQGQIHSSWSKDGSEELEKGWIIKADTIGDLAAKLGMSEDAAAKAIQSVETYNGYCEAGSDPQFGRTKNLEAIKNPPYYGIPLTHCTCNTQGGPRRNERGEVLDTEGNPIPHLYEAGELGDIWSNLYQAACNLGGGMIFGRISGANAAAEKDDNYRESLLSGKQGYMPEYAESVYETAANQYIGKGKGKGQAPLVMRLTIENEKITNAEVLEH
ncbi:MAG: FAD-dependent oxidoreductase, partial [Raoultibacter sp.]